MKTNYDDRYLKAVFVLFILIFFFMFNCAEDITGDLNENRPPDTQIFIQSEDTLNYTQSTQTLHWDGRDPDGFITGFYYSFAKTPQQDDWIWTTERSKTFPLQILGKDTVYTFHVKAVDDQEAEDPTPAHQLVPIKNTQPNISWTQRSRIPDTTFTVASFTWDASDPDGDETIDHFEYALDDTTTWKNISGTKRSIVLDADSGLTEGDHAFYIRAVDIAGAKSPVIRMPEVSSDYWYVREPRGRYLLVDDYKVESSNSAFPDRYYKSMLNNLLSQFGEDFSYWNIEDLFPASQLQFTESLKMFDRIIWYTDIISENDPHFIAAQVAIPEFRQTGGKIIYTVQFNSGFGGQGDPLAFSPVDSLGRSYNFISQNGLYSPDSAFAEQFPNLLPLPNLKLSKFVVGLIALTPKVTSIPMYRYQDPEVTEDPIFVMVGRNDNTGEYDFVFSGTPLHFLQGNNNLDELFEIVLRDLFSP